MAIYPSHHERSVLVTGGGGGIGAAIVEAFSKQGAVVGFLEIDPVAAAKTAANVEAKTGNRPEYRICDLRNVDATRQAVDQLGAICGPPTALINNAGNDRAQPFMQVTLDDWDDTLSTNLRHQFFMAQSVASSMTAAGGGAIVNLGSVCWMIGATGVPVYAIAKSAVAGLTKTLARELGTNRIRVNAINPGWVLTERQLAKGHQNPQKFTDYLERQCIKEHLCPDDIAEMALWLTSDESARCTGQMFTVDGGVT